MKFAGDELTDNRVRQFRTDTLCYVVNEFAPAEQ